MTTAERIEDFLNQKRIAIVGVSRNPKELSRGLFRDFVKNDYDVVPVNPHVTEIEGCHCYESVAQINPPVAGALLMTSPKEINTFVGECLSANIPRVWIFLGSGNKDLDPELASRCRESDVSLINGFCPYMFLPGSGFIHGLHSWFAKRSKAYRSE